MKFVARQGDDPRSITSQKFIFEHGFQFGLLKKRRRRKKKNFLLGLRLDQGLLEGRRGGPAFHFFLK
jgi:hypothetical protein